MEARGSGREAVRSAVAAAALLVGPLVAAKAVRDALFLSTFDVRRLPLMAAGAALVSLVATLAFSRAMARHSPARLLPISLGASAALFLAEWLLAPTLPATAAILLYLHHAVLGAVLVSGFWSLVNERFDPYAARRAMGAIGAGASLGGVVGGLLTWRAASVIDPASMLAALSAASLLGLASLAGLKARAAPGGAVRPAEGTAELSGLQLIRRIPYLRSLALLVALGAFLEAVLDYLLGAEAVQRFPRGASLMSFFALFHAGTGVLALAAQAALVRPALARLGVGGALGLQPAFTLLGALIALASPRLAGIVLLRGGMAVLRNSVFRASYELLYTPLPNEQKRPAKVIADVAFDRLGTVAGSGLVLLVLSMAPQSAAPPLLLLVGTGAAVALALAPRFHRGYVEALARSLRSGAAAVEPGAAIDPTALLTLASIQVDPATGTVVGARERGAGEPPGDPLAGAIADLRSGDPARIRSVTSRREIDPRLVGHLLPLLEHDDLFAKVASALRRAAPRCTGQLVDALLDPEVPAVVRRRIARVLKDVPSQRAADGLLTGLSDERFDLRYRCAQALARLRRHEASITIPAPAVVEAARREAGHAGLSPRHLEHVFTVLGLTLDPEPLDIARRALEGADEALRGTALEYLENVVPAPVREILWPHLGAPVRRADSGRSAEAVRDELLRSTNASATSPFDRRQKRYDRPRQPRRS